MTEYTSRGPFICEGCHTSPKRQADGAFRCECPGKAWSLYEPGAVRADEETTSLLTQKGFALAPCGWYYYSGGGALITLFSNGDWHLESGEGATIKNLKENLRSIPHQPSPIATN